MINFFRKTRHKLADNNQFLKYSRYAIGEILLVVIGILIALQINNWNEERKERDLERTLLENLIETLDQNSELLQNRIKRLPYYSKNGNVFIDAIENNLTYHDSLQRYFHRALMNTSRIEISSLGYEAIKNVGLEIIQNDTLKKEISVFFEEFQPHFLHNLNWGNIDSAYRENFIDEHFIQKYDTINNYVLYMPIDSENILQDSYFKALIYKTYNQRGYFIGEMKFHLEDTQRLLNMVREELKNNNRLK